MLGVMSACHAGSTHSQALSKLRSELQLVQQQLREHQTSWGWPEAELSRAAAKESAALTDAKTWEAKTWEAKYLQAQKDSMPPVCSSLLSASA